MDATAGKKLLDPSAGQAIGLRLAHQDTYALQDAYAAYAPMVLAYASRYVGRDEAEDVVQRTFLDAWRNAWRYDPDSASPAGCSPSPIGAPLTRCGGAVT